MQKPNLELTIDVDRIPDAGWTVRGELPEAWLGESLLEPYTAASPLSVHATARRYGDNVHVEAALSLDATFRCSRTLEPGQTRIEVEIHELFQPGQHHDITLGDGVSSEQLDGDEPNVYWDRVLDLEPLFREQLVLAQEPYPVVEEGSAPDEDEPLWSSGGDDIDPRWAKLQDLDV